MTSVDLTALQRYDNTELFIQALSSAQSYLRVDQAVRFYETVMQHFSDTVPEEIGKAILSVIAKLLEQDRYLQPFVQNKFPNSLPYNQKNLTDDLLEVLYILVCKAPIAFTQEVADGFSRMIVRRPRKSLLIISIYATYFEKLENPWPLLDDLINGQRRFSVDECAKEYVLLLANLVHNYRNFRRGRAKTCFDCIAQSLESENEDVINATYSALAIVVSYEKNIIVPFREVRAHLRFPQFQDSVLNFLLESPLNFDDIYNAKFLANLLKIAACSGSGNEATEAQKSIANKAALVLMRLAEEVKVATALVEQPKWMKADLPTTISTLRLFLVIFKHIQMRPIISKKDEFIKFLLNLNDVSDEQTHSLICTIIRRCDLTRELIHKMSKEKFIAAFLGNADEIGTDNAHYSAILLTDTLCKICYTKEMRPMCETVANLIQEGGDNLSPAIKLATDLCQHRQCVEKFQALRLAPYLERRINKMKNRGHVRALIKLIKQEEEVNE